MVYISKKQKEAMDIVGKIIEKLGAEHWFTKHELPLITEHSLEALVSKEYLRYVDLDHTGIRYYKKIKNLEPESKKRK